MLGDSAASTGGGGATAAAGGASVPPLPSMEQRALDVITARMEQEGLHALLPLATSSLRSINLANNERLFYVLISAAADDRYGYGSTSARVNAVGSQFGWGDKAVIANTAQGRAFVTTMGFHRYCFDLGNIVQLGVPLGDEYGCEGGAKQEFAHGNTFWKPTRGCYHERK